VSAAIERLVLFLYPTMVVLLSAIMLRTPVNRRTIVALVLSYAGIALVFSHDVAIGGDTRALAIGGAWVFVSALLYALYLVGAGEVIARLGSMRFISTAMLVSTLFVLVHFAAAREFAQLAAPPRVHALSLAMAIFSTVLPTWLIAEAIRRIGANATSLIGSLGPVSTIGLGVIVLGEPIYAVQMAGVALVLVGVTLVTLKRTA